MKPKSDNVNELVYQELASKAPQNYDVSDWDVQVELELLQKELKSLLAKKTE